MATGSDVPEKREQETSVGLDAPLHRAPPLPRRAGRQIP